MYMQVTVGPLDVQLAELVHQGLEGVLVIMLRT